MAAFDDEVVSAIAGYMNENQPDINLLIVQVHGHAPSATEATLIGFTEDAVDFDATVEGATRRVTVSWPRPATRRDQVRDRLFELYESAS